MFADGPGRLDAVQPRHADVHEHDVGHQLLGLGDDLLAVLGLGHHLDVGSSDSEHHDRDRGGTARGRRR